MKNLHLPGLLPHPNHGSLPVCQFWIWKAFPGPGKSRTCVHLSESLREETNGNILNIWIMQRKHTFNTPNHV